VGLFQEGEARPEDEVEIEGEGSGSGSKIEEGLQVLEVMR